MDAAAWSTREYANSILTACTDGNVLRRDIDFTARILVRNDSYRLLHSGIDSFDADLFGIIIPQSHLTTIPRSDSIYTVVIIFTLGDDINVIPRHFNVCTWVISNDTKAFIIIFKDKAFICYRSCLAKYFICIFQRPYALACPQSTRSQ